jgi:hypothetical protein
MKATKSTTTKKPTQQNQYSLPRVILFVSLLINAILISIVFGAALIAGDDSTTIDRGITALCSERHREKISYSKDAEGEEEQEISRKVNLAYNSYLCQANETAKTYFYEGFANYLESQDLPVPEDLFDFKN